MNRRISTLLTLTTSLTLPLLIVAPASAVTVMIDSLSYDVSVINRAYSGNEVLFQPLPLGMMPWSSDPTGDLADAFAREVFDQLGVEGPSVGFGPVFAYEYLAGDINGISQSLTDLNNRIPVSIASETAVNYAIATPLPRPSVPGPLPLFGAAAAFGWSRKLRRRIGAARP